jgi:immune inhibitor A
MRKRERLKSGSDLCPFRFALSFGLVTLSLRLFAMPAMPGWDARAAGHRWPGAVNRAEPVKRAVDQSGDILVLLVDFNDNGQSYASPEFEQLLFSSGSSSMRDYYLEASFGSLTIGGQIAGWYRADQPYSYYLGDSFGIYGDFPRNSQGLVAALVRAADPDVDFSRFDHDRDGVVDELLVVHAGPGAEETGNPRDVWSHKWQLSDPVLGSPGPVQTQDGVTVDAFSVQPERFEDGGLVSIGVFCHEFGHLLGMPDLYDTDYSTSGLGRFCLMAAGSWARASVSDPPGSCPVLPCAWSKYLLGWVRPESVEQGGVDSVEAARLPAAAANPAAYRVLDNPGGADWRAAGSGSGEYFLIENRQRLGFDRGLPGSGLLILHVDETQTDNSNEARPLVGILQADRSPGYALPMGDPGGDGDLWKESDTGVRSFTVPSSAFYDGVQSGAAIYNVSGSDSVMTADLKIAPMFLGRVYSFPNPVIVRTRSDRATIVYAPTDSARLAGRYPDFKVRIFDLAGDPVRVLDGPDEVNPQHRAAYWDVTNDRGRPATSGLYFYTVEIEEKGLAEQSVGRLTVVR